MPGRRARNGAGASGFRARHVLFSFEIWTERAVHLMRNLAFYGAGRRISDGSGGSYDGFRALYPLNAMLMRKLRRAAG